MEVTNITLDNPKEYDRLVHGTDGVPVLADRGVLHICTKNAITDGGRAGAVLSFDVVIDGKIARAQTVVTMRNLIGTLRILEARYGDDGSPKARRADHDAKSH